MPSTSTPTTKRRRRIFGRPIGLVLIVLYKGFWGMSEIFVGFLFFFSQRLIAGELEEDPSDLLVNWVLSHLHISFKDATHIGIVIIALGVAKLILALGIWYRSWLIRNLAIVFLTLFALYGLVSIGMAFSWLKCAAITADVLILLYLWKIFPKYIEDPAHA